MLLFVAFIYTFFFLKFIFLFGIMIVWMCMDCFLRLNVNREKGWGGEHVANQIFKVIFYELNKKVQWNWCFSDDCIKPFFFSITMILHSSTRFSCILSHLMCVHVGVCVCVHLYGFFISNSIGKLQFPFLSQFAHLFIQTSTTKYVKVSSVRK